MPNFVLTLAKPVQATGDKTITAITFREPTSEDVFALPEPFQTIVTPGPDGREGSQVEIKMNPTAARRWLERLCDCGPENMQMTASETRRVVGWLQGELNPSDEDGTSPKN